MARELISNRRKPIDTAFFLICIALALLKRLLIAVGIHEFKDILLLIVFSHIWNICSNSSTLRQVHHRRMS